MMAAANSLFLQVVKVTQDYLGPAAERFIARQIETHLKKKPDKLTKKDLAKLADWVKIAIGLLTEDSEQAKEFTKRLLALAK